MPVTPEVQTAIDELIAQHPEATVTAVPDGVGGAFITVDKIALSARFKPRKTWVKFHVTVNYPSSDVYPHFIEPDVRIIKSSYQDSAPMGEGTSVGTYRFAEKDLPAIQVSRASRNLNPAIDTAALKLVKVINWLESRA